MNRVTALMLVGCVGLFACVQESHPDEIEIMSWGDFLAMSTIDYEGTDVYVVYAADRRFEHFCRTHTVSRK